MKKVLENMRVVFKFIIILVLSLSSIIFFFGTYEPDNLEINFNQQNIYPDIAGYLKEKENRFPDIIPEVKKRVIWLKPNRKKTPFSIVYIHGFSATSEEIRPVPDNIANILGANLFFTRLTGHGRGQNAMSRANIKDWMLDIAEAIEIGRRIGERTILIASSTGGTIATAAALNPKIATHIDGLILVSPNFGINNVFASMLTWPSARLWVPLIIGKTQNSKIRNKLHAKYWTTKYPTAALFPMAAIVKKVTKQDFSRIKIPTLFYFSYQDKVVDPFQIKKIADNWGGKNKIINVKMTSKDDQNSHILAGDIVSPTQTDYAESKMLQWINATFNLLP
ncbi:MAG: alpha/beta hydrolase [Rhodospirillales bacterium]